MKTYAIYYELPTEYEAIIKAKTQKEAITKVMEVIGGPIKRIWEIKDKK